MAISTKVIALFLFLLVITSLYIISNNKEDNLAIPTDNGIYEGPLRPNEDVAHFRKTGYTRVIE